MTGNVSDVHRRERIVRGRELLASPDEPAARASGRRVTECIEWLPTVECRERDAKRLGGVGRQEAGTVDATDFALCVASLHNENCVAS